jgi:MYXO-CTERM domain-containing protein
MKDASSMKMDVQRDADSTSTRADTADGASASGTADPSSHADAALPTKVDGGCGCRTASEGRPGGSALALLLFVVGMGASRWMRRLAI